MNENIFYDRVAKELQAQTMIPALWVKAFADASGQVDKARALYIKLRVAQLTQEANEKLQLQKQAATKAAMKRAGSAVRTALLLILGIGFLLIAASFLIGLFSLFLESPRPEKDDLIGGVIGCFFGIGLFGLAAYACLRAVGKS